MYLLVKSGIWMVFSIFLSIIGKMLYQMVRRLIILRAIPSPPATPILGKGIDLINDTRDELFRKYREFAKEFRPIFRISFLHVDQINLVNAADIEQVLSNNNDTHKLKSEQYKCLHAWLGEGLFTSTGEQWQIRRKLLAPTFHDKILQDFLVSFNMETTKLVEKLKKNLDESGIDISGYIDHFTLQSSGDTAMGWDLVDEGVLIDYRQNIRKIREILIERFTNLWYKIDLFYKWTNLAYEEKKVVQSLHRFTNTVIRRRKVMRRGSTIERKELAMLDLLLKYREEGATIEDDGIREEVDTCLFVGNDTVGIAICMTLILLANHKDVHDKVIDEIGKVIGNKPRPVTHEDLIKLEYLECCIKETLRLYPSIPVIGRIACEDFVSSTGYQIPKGTVINIQIFDLHRDASVFPHPEKFDPDRFRPEESSKRNAFSYIPFGVGARDCIGWKFVMWEMKTVICGIMQNFRLAPVDTPMDIKFYMDLILKTNSPIRIKFIKK